jgi:hypothetical protein
MMTRTTSAMMAFRVRHRVRILFAAAAALLTLSPAALHSQENSDCLMCHSDKSLTTKRGGRTVSLFVDEKKFTGSIHNGQPCIGCHSDLTGKDFPHETTPKRADCGNCHSTEKALHAKSLHGKALARGDALAPSCRECHGTHDIMSSKDSRSPTSPLKVPFLCGKCHREGAPVARQRAVHQDHILENYSESIHGEGLLKKGLIVSATCVSCHSAHSILPHTDPLSTIARKNIASTCIKCHSQIEAVHRKIIRGELWEKEAHTLPACVDCHQPHKARRVFYSQGMADSDCLRCHNLPDVKSSKDGHSLRIDASVVRSSQHAKVACSQCHSEVNVSHTRPCETITKKVECSACHAEVAQQFTASTHGKLVAKGDGNAPNCKDCHGTHAVRGKWDPASPVFAPNIPTLCGQCHREGEKAAMRYKGSQHEIVNHYNESIHGKGLLKSGLTVTATCNNCHTAHGVLPKSDPASSVHPNNVAKTCGTCHYGIEEKFQQSVHARHLEDGGKRKPSCNDCHSAHEIRRTNETGFKLQIMQQCGRCHKAIAETYFDTYHGKVSQLGYTKTAKCYDCHGSHDILPISDPRSHLSRQNVVNTCKKCHAGATRRFAGYLTHATHHDPQKYPFLFWTFWGMTTLLIVTFVVGGLHTLLWLPRALKMRRELKRNELLAKQGQTSAGADAEDPAGGHA